VKLSQKIAGDQRPVFVAAVIQGFYGERLSSV